MPINSIVCIADTHGDHEKLKVPDGDMLIYAGDYTGHPSGYTKQTKNFNKWLTKQPHKYKIFIPGNHDWFFETNKTDAIMATSAANVLLGRGTLKEELKIWGAPHSPRFYDWAFNRSQEELRQLWATIPENVDILVTHCPPRGILDATDIEAAGCIELAKRLPKLKKLKVHVFGHIHEGYGVKRINGVVHVNCSIGYPWNKQYKPIVLNKGDW